MRVVNPLGNPASDSSCRARATFCVYDGKREAGVAHGVDAVIYIHIDYAELQHLRADGRGALIITGHLAGDSLGFTPFVRELRQRGLEVTTFSGVIEPNQ